MGIKTNKGTYVRCTELAPEVATLFNGIYSHISNELAPNIFVNASLTLTGERLFMGAYYSEIGKGSKNRLYIVRFFSYVPAEDYFWQSEPIHNIGTPFKAYHSDSLLAFNPI